MYLHNRISQKKKKNNNFGLKYNYYYINKIIKHNYLNT